MWGLVPMQSAMWVHPLLLLCSAQAQFVPPESGEFEFGLGNGAPTPGPPATPNPGYQPGALDNTANEGPEGAKGHVPGLAYDCQVDYERCEQMWSQQKKVWCNEHEMLPCVFSQRAPPMEQTLPPLAPTPAPTTMPLPPPPTTRPPPAPTPPPTIPPTPPPTTPPTPPPTTTTPPPTTTTPPPTTTTPPPTTTTPPPTTTTPPPTTTTPPPTTTTPPPTTTTLPPTTTTPPTPPPMTPPAPVPTPPPSSPPTTPPTTPPPPTPPPTTLPTTPPTTQPTIPPATPPPTVPPTTPPPPPTTPATTSPPPTAAPTTPPPVIVPTVPPAILPSLGHGPQDLLGPGVAPTLFPPKPSTTIVTVTLSPSIRTTVATVGAASAGTSGATTSTRTLMPAWVASAIPLTTQFPLTSSAPTEVTPVPPVVTHFEVTGRTSTTRAPVVGKTFGDTVVVSMLVRGENVVPLLFQAQRLADFRQAVRVAIASGAGSFFDRITPYDVAVEEHLQADNKSVRVFGTVIPSSKASVPSIHRRLWMHPVHLQRMIAAQLHKEESFHEFSVADVGVVDSPNGVGAEGTWSHMILGAIHAMGLPRRENREQSLFDRVSSGADGDSEDLSQAARDDHDLALQMILSSAHDIVGAARTDEEHHDEHRGPHHEVARTAVKEEHLGGNKEALPQRPHHQQHAENKGHEGPEKQSSEEAREKMLTFFMSVANVDYGLLTKNEAVSTSFQKVIKDTIVAAGGPALERKHVSLSVSAGSVRVFSTITGLHHEVRDKVEANLKAAEPALASLLSLRVQALAGIHKVTTGVVSVSDLHVASQTHRDATGEGEPKWEHEKVEEAEEEDEWTVQDVALAQLMLGLVISIMVLFYLVNWRKTDVRRNAWSIISTTIAIFVSVLVFDCVSGFVDDFLASVHFLAVHLIANYLMVLGLFVAMQATTGVLSGAMVDRDDGPSDLEEEVWVVSDPADIHYGKRVQLHELQSAERAQSINASKGIANLEGRQVFVRRETQDKDDRIIKMNCYVSLLTYMTAFATINAGNTLMQHKFFAANPATASIPILISLMFLWGLYMLFRLARGPQEKGPQVLWDMECSHAQSDIACLSGSFMFVQVIRFWISGVLPDKTGLESPERAHSLVCILLLYALGLAAAVASVLLPSLPRRVMLPTKIVRTVNLSYMLRNTSCMTFAWCMIFSTRWLALRIGWLDSLGLAPGTLAWQIIMAGASFFLAFSFILLLRGIERTMNGPSVEELSQSVVTSLGLLVGFSFQRLFEVALERVEDQSASTTWIKLGLYCAIAAIVVPAWRKYIIVKVWRYRGITHHQTSL